MDEKERIALIEEKQAEIDRLKSEIKDLRTGYMKTMVKNDFIRTVGIIDGEVVIMKGGNGWSNEWEDIKALASKIFFVKHDRGLSWYGDEFYHSLKMKQNDMTDEQRKIAAEFCDEVIPIYNKYVMMVNSFVLDGTPYSLKEGGTE